ncbi:MAG: phosphodiester glycosidase family protein [Bacteroidia bacterium]
MKLERIIYALVICSYVIACNTSAKSKSDNPYAEAHSLIAKNDSSILYHIVEAGNPNLRMYLKDQSNNSIKTFKNLSKHVSSQGEILTFAMNGGMFTKEFMPLGLYIEDGQEITKIKRGTKGYGNFYLQPNGVFYITNQNVFQVTKTSTFELDSATKYATQSGPMLVHDGEINSNFGPKSSSTHIRNGVGILPNGDAIFAISHKRINFYEFASFFNNQGCKNALYLDGFVSRVYPPISNDTDLDMTFGVIIGEVKED